MTIERKVFENAVVPLESVPRREVQKRWAERAMDFSTAKTDFDLLVEGAFRDPENNWRVALTYKRVEEGEVISATPELCLNILGQSFRYFVTLGVRGKYGEDSYRDYYIEEPR